MTYLLLFWEFFKTGLFAIGGGYATLPFLTAISDNYGWYSHSQLANLIAISEVTPGPIGVNMATFAGYITTGVVGGIVATIALILPALIIILSLSHFVPNYREKPVVQNILYGILPVALGLLAAAGWQLFNLALLSFTELSTTIWAWALFAILLVIALPKWPIKISPLWLLLIGGIWGFLFL